MKIGDYVRTKYGIGKYIDDEVKSLRIIVIDSYIANDHNEDYRNVITRDEIIKSSPNIIELLEEHDFITIEYYSLRYDKRVERIFEVDYKDKEFMTLKNAYCDFRLKNNEFNDKDKALEPIIKSILTKEQFESMEYKIGE